MLNIFYYCNEGGATLRPYEFNDLVSDPDDPVDMICHDDEFFIKQFNHWS